MRKIPLPDELSGNVEERVIRLDSALFYIVDGALSALLDYQHYEQTGALTEEDVKSLLDEMYSEYLA